MISGTMTSLFEMVIELPVRDSTGTIREIEVVIDTGFTGSLSLPRSVIASLGRPWLCNFCRWQDGRVRRACSDSHLGRRRTPGPCSSN